MCSDAHSITLKGRDFYLYNHNNENNVLFQLSRIPKLIWQTSGILKQLNVKGSHVE